jgi:GalNAc-alpha-(1->4)-GalNAc-alpha-(1->3)-diNAcBac-PP-undecaprenol alpha-1,4-N-acetyl-D-galactosaminyltransferase
MKTGGAERVTSLLLNEFVSRKHRAELFSFSTEESTYQLSEEIARSPLDISTSGLPLFGKITRGIYGLFTLRSVLLKSHADVLISHMDLTNMMVLGVLLTIPRSKRPTVIVCEHTVPSRSDIATVPLFGPVLHKLRCFLYLHAARIVLLTEGSRKDFPQVLAPKISVIPNPLQPPPAPPLRTPSEKKTILAVGRLSAEKGHCLLIESFASLHKEFPDWHLRIVGEGPLRASLEAQIAHHNLTSSIELPGTTSAIYEEYTQADIFAFPSEHEGFGMALAEALSCGVPAVAMDCPVGPREILRDGVDGFLVPVGDLAQFTTALRTLMSDDALRESLAKRAPEVFERFALSTVVDKWENLFEEVTRQ